MILGGRKISHRSSGCINASEERGSARRIQWDQSRDLKAGKNKDMLLTSLTCVKPDIVFLNKGAQENPHNGWLMYLLTGEKLFFLHSAAFSAGGIQGIAHGLAAEEGTLPQLNDSHYEFAHCSYFPLLALHRIVEHLGNRALVVARAAARAQ